MIELYQFRSSHFCEKARWALDYKGIPYRARNLVPGPHVKAARRIAPRSCLPIIVDEGKAIQDSPAIITYLDRKVPDRPLTPRDAAQAEEALGWEKYLDEEIGVTLRLWFYYHVLPDRDRAVQFLLNEGPWYGRPLYALIFPRIRGAMIKLMNINAESARQAEARFHAAVERLNDALKERHFLVGDRFSRADLTAGALLAAYCRPDETIPITLPEPVRALRERHETSRFFGWVCDLYREHRQPAALVQ